MSKLVAQETHMMFDALGNGHMMMIESNSYGVAKLVLSWVEGT